MKGTHDDSIMSFAMATYVGDTCFDQLQKNDLANKSMMDAWTLSERTYEPNKSFYSYGQAFDPMGSMTLDGKPHEINPLFENDSVLTGKQLYKEYGWLFAGLNKHK